MTNTERARFALAQTSAASQFVRQHVVIHFITLAHCHIRAIWSVPARHVVLTPFLHMSSGTGRWRRRQQFLLAREILNTITIIQYNPFCLRSSWRGSWSLSSSVPVRWGLTGAVQALTWLVWILFLFLSLSNHLQPLEAVAQHPIVHYPGRADAQRSVHLHSGRQADDFRTNSSAEWYVCVWCVCVCVWWGYPFLRWQHQRGSFWCESSGCASCSAIMQMYVVDAFGALAGPCPSEKLSVKWWFDLQFVAFELLS